MAACTKKDKHPGRWIPYDDEYEYDPAYWTCCRSERRDDPVCWKVKGQHSREIKYVVYGGLYTWPCCDQRRREVVCRSKESVLEERRQRQEQEAAARAKREQEAETLKRQREKAEQQRLEQERLLREQEQERQRQHRMASEAALAERPGLLQQLEEASAASTALQAELRESQRQYQAANAATEAAKAEAGAARAEADGSRGECEAATQAASQLKMQLSTSQRELASAQATRDALQEREQQISSHPALSAAFVALSAVADNRSHFAAVTGSQLPEVSRQQQQRLRSAMQERRQAATACGVYDCVQTVGLRKTAVAAAEEAVRDSACMAELQQQQQAQYTSDDGVTGSPPSLLDTALRSMKKAAAAGADWMRGDDGWQALEQAGAAREGARAEHAVALRRLTAAIGAEVGVWEAEIDWQLADAAAAAATPTPAPTPALVGAAAGAAEEGEAAALSYGERNSDGPAASVASADSSATADAAATADCGGRDATAVALQRCVASLQQRAASAMGRSRQAVADAAEQLVAACAAEREAQAAQLAEARSGLQRGLKEQLCRALDMFRAEEAQPRLHQLQQWLQQYTTELRQAEAVLSIGRQVAAVRGGVDSATSNYQECANGGQLKAKMRALLEAGKFDELQQLVKQRESNKQAHCKATRTAIDKLAEHVFAATHPEAAVLSLRATADVVASEDSQVEAWLRLRDMCRQFQLPVVSDWELEQQHPLPQRLQLPHGVVSHDLFVSPPLSSDAAVEAAPGLMLARWTAGDAMAKLCGWRGEPGQWSTRVSNGEAAGGEKGAGCCGADEGQCRVMLKRMPLSRVRELRKEVSGNTVGKTHCGVVPILRLLLSAAATTATVSGDTAAAATAAGDAYLEMPYCSGGTLAQWLLALNTLNNGTVACAGESSGDGNAGEGDGESEATLLMAHILPVFTFLTEALQHLHAQGVLHLDLKPTNVVFTASGRPCLIDFGTAKQVNTVAIVAAGGVGNAPTATATTRLCSGAYVAPDYRDNSAPASASVDVFALGTMLLEAVAAQGPFTQQARTADSIPGELWGRIGATIDAAAAAAGAGVMGEEGDSPSTGSGVSASDCGSVSSTIAGGFSPVGELLPLLRRMLSADGSERPSLSDVHDVLLRATAQLSSSSAHQSSPTAAAVDNSTAQWFRVITSGGRAEYEPLSAEHTAQLEQQLQQRSAGSSSSGSSGGRLQPRYAAVGDWVADMSVQPMPMVHQRREELAEGEGGDGAAAKEELLPMHCDGVSFHAEQRQGGAVVYLMRTEDATAAGSAAAPCGAGVNKSAAAGETSEQ